jgi:hypothetical protein
MVPITRPMKAARPGMSLCRARAKPGPPSSPPLYYKSPSRGRRHRWMSSLQMLTSKTLLLKAAPASPPKGTAVVISSYNPMHSGDHQELRRHLQQASDLGRYRLSQERLAGPISEFEDEVYSGPRRPELRPSQRLQSRNKDLPSLETLTEITLTPLNHRGQPGRRITYEGKTKFVPDPSWTPCTQN